MTDPNPFGDGEVIVCYGGAKPADTHLASIIHCVDDEVIGWLERLEAKRKKIPVGLPQDQKERGPVEGGRASANT